jgi:long-chain acyl-CoA synthetase
MYPGPHAARFPDKPAVIMAETGDTLTYRELDDRSLRFARYLFEAGVRQGDHVALLTENDPKAFEVYWAALRSGLYITLVNWHLPPDDITYIVNDCDATALIVSAGLPESVRYDVDGTPKVRIRLAYNGSLPGHGSYEDAVRNTAPEPLPAQPRGADMLYSSGTTGRPKGVRPPLPTYGIDEPKDVASLVLTKQYGFDPDTVYLSMAPIYHAGPLRFAGVVQGQGGTVVLAERFDAEGALAAIERYRVTHSQWVPTMFVRMLKLDEAIRGKYDLSSHRVAAHAAAPCPIDVKRAMIDWWGPILREYYSNTEGNGGTLISSEDWLRKPGSVGRALMGGIHICGEDGAELAVGQIGTVYFELGRLAFEYHNSPEQTAQSRHPSRPGWTTTGDIGRLDEDGFLYLTDRKAFMIISGGVNIYPQEIEDGLALHPAVFDIAVIGVPDAEMGESVKAVVQPAPGVQAGPELAEQLRQYLRDRIAHYKVPRSFDFVDELPRTPTGKLLKRQIRERYL